MKARGLIGKFQRAARAIVADPVEALLDIPERISMRHDYRASYKADPEWEARLHSWLAAAWPCPEGAMVDTLTREVELELQTQGLRMGRGTYGEYSDADLSMVRAVWCTVLHQRPSVVIETGVARGVTSRIVLEALDRNDLGHLWSIDLPHPQKKELHVQIGAAVPSSHRGRWSYVEGSSRRRLPSLLRSIAQVDLFIHDSLHTARNTRFEMEQTLRTLASEGIMIVDDISPHQAFAEFARDFPQLETLVCPHSDRAGSFFGIVHKPRPSVIRSCSTPDRISASSPGLRPVG
jgi:Methyltransferase domain